VKGRSGKKADHGVVRMEIHVAIAAEGEHHLGAETTDVLDQISRDPRKVLARQPTVGVSQHLSVGNVQHPQSCSEFPPPQSGQLVAATGIPPVRCRASFGQADHAGLNAPLVRLHQRTAEGPTLVIGVGGKTHQPQWQIDFPHFSEEYGAQAARNCFATNVALQASEKLTFCVRARLLVGP
jgi:hypothetical protein